MPASITPQEFVNKWRGVELKERSASQEHFLDLCHLVGHPTPVEADTQGGTFCFEAGASKQRGSQGWADVWYRGHFAWEYKGPHANLDKAYQQLLQYRESLLNPPLLVVSDMEQIVVHTNFTNTVQQVVSIGLDDLLQPGGLARLRDIFFDPQAFCSPLTPEQVTLEAAGEFARLAELLRKYGAEPQEAAHFLIRLLFCLFAEDVGLLPKALFTELVQNTTTNTVAFAGQLRQLFAAMSTGGWFGAQQIRNFDGTLFDDAAVLELDYAGMRALAKVCVLDWSYIEPSIFGTLFERSLDPSKRSQLGAHYTSRDDILLIVEPVLMAPLRRRWQEVQQQARLLARRRDETTTPRTRANRERELSNLLVAFAHEIAQVQVLDAACGSGNFLYVALKLLLDLWKEISTLASDLGLPLMMPLSGVSPSPEQLHGIEINEYAHELAQATIWIGYIQWLNENGFGSPEEPILKPLENILHMDAILIYDGDGHPAEPEWPEVSLIIGNPPFLGSFKLRSALGDEYAEALFDLYRGRVPGGADLVCYWFEKARALIEAGKLQRAGLLATQGIRGGASLAVLQHIKETGDIFWAYADRAWILDGADVRVSMIGFDDGRTKTRYLDGRPVETINCDLSSNVDLTDAHRLEENSGLAYSGSQKIGPFDISAEVAEQMLAAKGNPNGRPNSDVVRPSANGSDIMHRSRNVWIIDFGVDMTEEEAAEYEAPFEYIKQHVYPVRIKNRRAAYAKRWWQHGEPGPARRSALRGLSRFIVTSRVARHRVFVWLRPPVLPDYKLGVFVRDDDYFFGVLHSRVHEVWSLKMGGRHGVGNDPVYNVGRCFETFPFPWPPGQEPAGELHVQAIAAAARDLVEKRDRWLNPEGASEGEFKRRTLTNLYNQRPTWLDLAHRKLDHAVLDAYGWPHDLADEQVLERLLALNLEQAGKEK